MSEAASKSTTCRFFHRSTPTTLPAREAMELAAKAMLVALLVISDRTGVIPSDADWRAFVEAAGHVEALAMEYRT